MAASTANFVSAIDSILERKDKLHTAFSDLESKKIVGPNWDDFDAYFTQLENRLRSTLEGLSSREEAMVAKMKEATEALSKRTSDIIVKEESSLVRIQELKDAAVAVVLEVKSKWAAEKQELGAVNEEDSLSKRDEGFSEDEDNAMEIASPEHDFNAVKSRGGGGKSPVDTLSLSRLLEKEASAAALKSGEIKIREELVSFCQAMDADKLQSFISENKKGLNSISAELPSALKSASDPVKLVLKAVEGFYPSDQNTSPGSTTVLSNKRACIIMLEALGDVLAEPEPPIIVSEEMKKLAKEIADLWKSQIDFDGDQSNLPINAQCFLQLSATFGLASEYDHDELYKMFLRIAQRNQTPSLCRSLDLFSKVPDVIESLINDGKQMEAITFATEFGLLDRFDPVPLLKAYLKDSRKVLQDALKGGNNSVAIQQDCNQKEFMFTKTVLKSIIDLKLEERFSPSPLERRVAQLEKATADRKRSAMSGKPPQMKRPRINNIGPPIGRRKLFYRPEHRPHYGEALLPYGSALQPMYDPSMTAYVPPYTVAAKNPTPMQNSYMYASDGSTAGYAPSAYNPTMPSAAYSGYGYGMTPPPG